ncbi:hypothetical protein [Methylosinus sp. Sm6]|uniref:hypothetical protein n=1 Tax=Methylosinus sp. Sm6 TaxID=2866948 RepID=UPI001C99B0F2|nr:hypothetical protein [Methylosinus sp. Sm6]MBY6239842.1 hypothetical protein [Methylosinus sp. Sm6]
MITEIERLVTRAPAVATAAADLRRAIVTLFASGRRESEKAEALAALDRFDAAVDAAGPSDIAKILRAD